MIAQLWIRVTVAVFEYCLEELCHKTVDGTQSFIVLDGIARVHWMYPIPWPRSTTLFYPEAPEGRRSGRGSPSKR